MGAGRPQRAAVPGDRQQYRGGQRDAPPGNHKRRELLYRNLDKEIGHAPNHAKGGERHSDGGGDRGGDHRSDGGGDRGRGGDGRWDGGRGRGPDPGAYRGERWDQNRNNGYYYNNRWYYGPPPQTYYGMPGFHLGFSDWRRGGYLPSYYRGWALDDYPRYHLRRPPYGYHWVRIGNEFLLVSSSSGLIFDVIVDGPGGY